MKKVTYTHHGEYINAVNDIFSPYIQNSLNKNNGTKDLLNIRPSVLLSEYGKVTVYGLLEKNPMLYELAVIAATVVPIDLQMIKAMLKSINKIYNEISPYEGTSKLLQKPFNDNVEVNPFMIGLYAYIINS